MQRRIVNFIKKHHLLLFFSAWFLLNLLQAARTGLFDDEAYYWVYSRYLAWGYFDHPPMIAILIRAGYFLFHNELGVRLFIVIVSTATLLLIYRMLPRKDDRLFYLIACSVCVLQIGGVMAVPDLPLIFFVALFFISYKNFLHRLNAGNAVVLGIVMALLLYTKYHGLLVILFTFFSNPKLALNKWAYLAVLTGTLLFLPHLYWQYVNGFPSVQFHLVERNAPAYKLTFSLGYILDQILLPGPLVGWLLIWAAFRYQAGNLLERALKFSLFGFYAFFLLSTFKGTVEANWTVPVLIPLIILSHQYLIHNAKLARILAWCLPLNLLLVFAVRSYMMMDVVPYAFLAKDEFHKNKEWADTIYNKTQGLPVLFINSYQKASKYQFYNGTTSFSLNTPTYRRNNYNFWPIEDSLYNKRVAAISPYDYSYYKDSINTSRGPTGLLIVDSFFSFSKLKIIVTKNPEAVNGIITCALQITTPENYLAKFQEKRFIHRSIGLTVYKDKKKTLNFPTGIRLPDIRQIKQTQSTSFNVNLPKGTYYAGFTMPSSLAIDPSLNSKIFTLVVK